MFEDLKKKILRNQLVFTVIVILAGLGLAGWNATNAYYAVFGYADFKSLTPQQIRGQLVEVDLTANLGCYLTVKTTRTSSGRTTTTYDYYYLIWTGDDYAVDDNWRYMSIKIPSAYRSQMEAMAQNTDEGYSSEPIRFYGKIKKLSGEDYDTFLEIFDGYTDAQIDAMTLPYYINTFANKTAMNVMYILLFAAGVFLTIFGIARITKVASGGSLKKLRQDIAAAGISESMADSDYRSATAYNKKGDIKIGRLMTYYLSGDNARAIPNSKIMWAYQHTVTHRRNGIKTGTTYSIMIFDELFPKGHTISVDNEAVVQAMLKQMLETLPWVVVGYTDDLKRAYNKNRSEFLQIRYNTCEHVAVEPGTITGGNESPAPNTQA